MFSCYCFSDIKFHILIRFRFFKVIPCLICWLPGRPNFFPSVTLTSIFALRWRCWEFSFSSLAWVIKVYGSVFYQSVTTHIFPVTDRNIYSYENLKKRWFKLWNLPVFKKPDVYLTRYLPNPLISGTFLSKTTTQEQLIWIECKLAVAKSFNFTITRL